VVRNLEKLSNAAMTVITAAIVSAIFAPPSMCVLKSKATMAAPLVCPSDRTVLSIPAAAPLRARGADDIIVRLLGAWKKPKPSPQRAMRHMKSNAVPLPGKNARNINPAESAMSPKPQRIAAE
jgi:hypothetical protein